MKTLRRHSILAILTSTLVACGGGGDDGAGNQQAAPPPMNDHPGCVISADCPSGEHCDLGECIQECSTETPCDTGYLCSPRARCLVRGQADTDPEPTAVYQGSVQASPTSVQLTDGDQELTIELNTQSTEKVAYRVVIAAPHLSIDQPRGEFQGKTTLKLHVERGGLTGVDSPGSVQIITSLGNVVVDAPLHVGLTGRYQGTLRYDGGPVQLGDARVAFEVMESNSDVKARVDSNESLLFPQTQSGDTTGHGVYDGAMASITLSQRLETSFGGQRNHFGRDIGRRMTFSLEPVAGGKLEGTFKETVYGLLQDPVVLTGRALFTLVPGAPEPAFTLAQDPAMPDAPNAAPWSATEVFDYSDACPVFSSQDPVGYVAGLEQAYHAPLPKALELTPVGSSPISDVAESCRATLSQTKLSDWQASSAGCSNPVMLACADAWLLGLPISGSSASRARARLVAEIAAPALVVAQDDIVSGLYASFSQGPTAERAKYDEAAAALSPTAKWLLSPAVLTSLADTSPSDAAGDPQSTDPLLQDFPSIRALARLLYVSSNLDAARARTDTTSVDQAGARHGAQERAVLTFLEAAALSSVLEAWGASPTESVGSTLAGVLNPLDQSFASLAQGPLTFGVPDGFVPFVYRAEDAGKGATNFEQMLAIAVTPVSEIEQDQTAFEQNKRIYEQNEATLNAELSSVRTTYDLSLKDICGKDFDPDSVVHEEDWQTCGVAGTGQVGAAQLEIDLASSRLKSAEGRILGMKQKIAISQKQLADTQAVHESTLRFIDSTGKQLEALTWSEGILNAAQTAIQTAKESNVLNLGAPAAMAGVSAMLEMEKAALAVARQRLETAQTMKFEQASADIELINGMAEIQKQMIDLAQLEVDMEQDVIGVLQAQLSLGNALDKARSLHEERARSLTAIAGSPLRDPTYRLLRDSLAIAALRSRSEAQRSLYLAGRALEYEINQPLSALSGAVQSANNSARLKKLQVCLTKIHDGYRLAHGTPQEYVTEVSLRRMLGITGPRVDEVTGENLDEGELFRRELLKNENLDGKGGVGITFTTNLQAGNGLFATDVCADKIAGIRAQIVGDFLGDNQAQVNLSLSGGSVMRACEADEMTSWSLGAGSGSGSNAFAVVQAGVNGWGAAPANASLFGQSVARASWRLLIPSAADAPSNADLDLTHIADIVLELTHKALPRQNSPMSVDLSCLGAVGG